MLDFSTSLTRKTSIFFVQNIQKSAVHTLIQITAYKSWNSADGWLEKHEEQLNFLEWYL